MKSGSILVKQSLQMLLNDHFLVGIYLVVISMAPHFSFYIGAKMWFHLMWFHRYVVPKTEPAILHLIRKLQLGGNLKICFVQIFLIAKIYFTFDVIICKTVYSYAL